MALTVKIVVPTTQREIEVPTGLFINNEFVPSADSNELIRCVYHRPILILRSRS